MKSNREKPEYSLIISPEALEDISDIMQYTLAEWGHSQVKIYRGILANTFSSIQNNPYIGHKRIDIPSRHLAFQAGQHVIIYRIEKYSVYIIRILHGSMDFTHQFDK